MLSRRARAASLSARSLRARCTATPARRPLCRRRRFAIEGNAVPASRSGGPERETADVTVLLLASAAFRPPEGPANITLLPGAPVWRTDSARVTDDALVHAEAPATTPTDPPADSRGPTAPPSFRVASSLVTADSPLARAPASRSSRGSRCAAEIIAADDTDCGRSRSQLALTGLRGIAPRRARSPRGPPRPIPQGSLLPVENGRGGLSNLTRFRGHCTAPIAAF